MATVIIRGPFLFLVIFLLTSVSTSTSTSNTSSAIVGGLSISLIHRFSRHFPYYDPNTTRTDVWKALTLQSTSRLSHHKAALRGVVTPQGQGGVQLPNPHATGIYMTTVTIGSPPVDVRLYADTGSTLIWTQCSPCTQCNTEYGPIYNPSQSTTKSDVECASERCNALRNGACQQGLCTYKILYASGQNSTGRLVKDNFILLGNNGQNLTFPNVVFGCADDKYFRFRHGSTGLLGLSAGALSLVSQLGLDVDGFAFSYCLVPYAHENTPTSKLLLGKGAALLGSTTKMKTVGINGNYHYYLQLEDISVGPNRLDLPPGIYNWSSPDPDSSFIIDSGTTITSLRQDVFEMVVEAVAASVTLDRTSTGGDVMALCYFGNAAWDLRDNSTSVPTMTFHFAGGLDVVLKPSNIFFELSGGVLCLAMFGTDDVSVWGNVAQQNLNIGYDLQNELLYVLPKDCASA